MKGDDNAKGNRLTCLKRNATDDNMATHFLTNALTKTWAHSNPLAW